MTIFEILLAQVKFKISREDDLREGFPVPRDNFLKSINEFCVMLSKVF